MDESDDYYNILGVSRDSTLEELNKQRKRLLLKFHPDKIKDHQAKKEAEAKAQKINEAYDVLSNPEKRKLYDAFGKEGLNGDGGFRPGGFGPGMFPFDLGNIGDFMRGGIPRNQNVKKVIRPINTIIDMTLEQIFEGLHTKTNIERFTICNECSNTGFSDKKKHICTGCNGRKVITTTHQIAPGMIQQAQHPCNLCRATGQDLNHPNKCTKCSGEGVVREIHSIDIDINPGVKKGDQITIKGQGHEAVINGNHERGDVIVVVNELPHEVFKRRDTAKSGMIDLEITINIALHEALCGFVKSFKYLDGQTYYISPPGMVLNDEVLVIHRMGLLHSNGYKKGDLYVKFKVLKSDKLNKKRRALIYKILTGNNYSPKKLPESNLLEMIDLSSDPSFATQNSGAYEGSIYESDDSYDGEEQVQCTHQ